MRLFDLEIRNMTLRLAEYRKATRRYIAANPNPKTSRDHFDQKFYLLVESLRDPDVSSKFVEMFSHDDEAYQTYLHLSEEDNVERLMSELSFEIDLMVKMGFKRSDAEDMFEYTVGYTQRDDFEQFSVIDDLITKLQQVHDHTIAVVEEARTLDRKGKKIRKRDVKRGSLSATFGTGLIVGNTQFPPLAPVSYGAGLFALHQALRDFVGEPQ